MQSMKKNQGISLIEILVTLLVLSFGLLGLAGLQMYSLQTNNSAYMRSQATYLVMDMFDRMRLNRSKASGGDYDFNAGASLVDHAFDTDADALISGDYDAATVAQRDLYDWVNLIEDTLPGGAGSVDCTNPGNSVCRVAVRWNDTRGRYQGENCAVQDPACFIAESRL